MSAIDTIREFNAKLREAAKNSNVRASDITGSLNSEQNKNSVRARSGNNISFIDSTNLSDNYAKALKDAIKFYQGEFKLTPHADISSNIDEESKYGSLGLTYLTPTGGEGDQTVVDIRYLRPTDEQADLDSEAISVGAGWHPKNSVDLGNTPIHEFGHVISNMVFPLNKDGSENKNLRKLYEDSLADVGIKDEEPDYNYEERGYLNKFDKDAYEKIKEMSGYAASYGHMMDYGEDIYFPANPQEAVAEALVDYYYNRENATDFAKAVVKRLKSNSQLYGLKRAGGIDTDAEPGAQNFVRNLRRYSVIH